MNRLEKNTLGMFDCLKGVIILYVICVHTYTDILAASQIDTLPFPMRFLNNFQGIAMAVLFAISGYQFKPIKTKKMFKKPVPDAYMALFLDFCCQPFPPTACKSDVSAQHLGRSIAKSGRIFITDCKIWRPMGNSSFFSSVYVVFFCVVLRLASAFSGNAPFS